MSLTSLTFSAIQLKPAEVFWNIKWNDDKAQRQRTQDKELKIPNSQSKGPLPNIAPSKAGFWEGRSGYGPNLQDQQTEYTRNIQGIITNYDKFAPSIKMRRVRKSIDGYN